MRKAERLGASLYIPATRPKLTSIANGQEIKDLRSMIFCTEDSVSAKDLPFALQNLATTLDEMDAFTPALRFVRVRNEAVMAEVVRMKGVEKLDGFVIPKATSQNIEGYFQLLQGNMNHLVMLTLETKEVFCDEEMRIFRSKISAPEVKSRILALRIGGNDLLALLGVRRPRHVTIYKTPLGAVISRLVTMFRPHGFHLTAPVFEHMDLPELLAKEVSEDMLHGLVGKSAIHPTQIQQIEQNYRVMSGDVAVATKIMMVDTPAVFKMEGSMCEVATHRSWAESILTRRLAFGELESKHPTLN